MPYATQTDLEARLAPDLLLTLTDDDGDETPDATVIAAALDDASAEIDQSLAARYVTPVASPPSIMKGWCANLALSRLFSRKRQELPREQAEQVAFTRRTLQVIATGQAGLAGAEPRLDEFESENTRRGQAAAFTYETLEPY